MFFKEFGYIYLMLGIIKKDMCIYFPQNVAISLNEKIPVFRKLHLFKELKD